MITTEVELQKRKKKKEHNSLFIFGPRNKFRLLVIRITESKYFEWFILLAIVSASVIMALDAPLPFHDKSQMNLFADKTELYFFAVFVLEAILKIIGMGFILHENSYLRSVWNIIDFIVIILSILSLPGILPGVSEVNVKGLRVIRVLHPLKFVSGFQSLHVVMTAIARAIVPLLQVLFLIVFVISIYAIIGLEFMADRFHFSCKNKINGSFSLSNDGTYRACDSMINEYFFVHGNECSSNETCSRFTPGVNQGISSFDNIFYSMLTVFQCVTLEGWADIMYYTQDVMDLVGIIWNTYYVTLILIGSFFMLHLVLGVLSSEFAKEREKVENRQSFFKLREDQQCQKISDFYLEWISRGEDLTIISENTKESQKETSLSSIISNPAVVLSSLNLQLHIKSYHSKSVISFHIKHLRLKLRNFIKRNIFFWFVVAMVSINTFILATYHYKQPIWLTDIQKLAEKIFTVFFILEMLLKVFALSFHGYCKSRFNVFELIVVILSIFDITTRLGAGVSVLQCLRLLRVFKVTKYWSRLRNLVASFMNAVNSILSLLFLLLLYILINALLGMQLFGGKFDTFTRDKSRANFDSFPDSLLAVFQVITGEDWNSVMYSGMLAYGAPNTVLGILVSLYFLLLVVFGNYTLLNVFLAIAVDNLANADILTQDESELENRGMSTSTLSNGAPTVEEEALSVNNIQSKKSEDTQAVVNESPFLTSLSDVKPIDLKIKVDGVSNGNNTLPLNSNRRQSSFGNIGDNTLSIDLNRRQSSFGDNLLPLYFNRRKSSLSSVGKFQLTLADAIESDGKFNLKSVKKYKKNVQKQWLQIVDQNTSSKLNLNVDDILNKINLKKNTDFYDLNANNKSLDINQNGGCNGLAESAEEDSVEKMIQSKGFLSMLKVNVAQRKRINMQPPVQNVRSLFIFSPTNRFRVLCHKIVYSRYFDPFMVIMIVLSSLVLCIQDPVNDNNSINLVIDDGFILHKGAYIRNPWNKLDALIFVCNLSSVIFSITLQNDKSTSSASAFLRYFTLLRPIKAIQKVKKLKIVFQCMVYSLKNVAFVLIITLLMLFIFACIGVQLFQGKLYHCTDSSKSNEVDCKGNYYEFSNSETDNIIKTIKKVNKRDWTNDNSNFDNILSAAITLYICSTEDNWPSTMYRAIDTAVDMNRKVYAAIYFVTFIVLFTFMIINIYIALIILTFQKQGEKEIQAGLDRNQCDCLHFVLNAKPRQRYKPKDENSISFHIWMIVESRPFDYFIMSLIILNCLQMMMKFNGSSQQYKTLMFSLNVGFSIMFSIEVALKVFAYRWNYFKNLWNLFDLFVILGGFLDIILTLKKTKLLDPSMFRLFRALRAIKLLRKGTNIRIMLWTFLRSIRALPYITGLILLMSYVYAILGMELFAKIELDGSNFHAKNNFRNIYNSLLLLFRCSTGENWSSLMYACYNSAKCEKTYFDSTGTKHCGNTVAAVLYFTTYMFFCMFLLLNLFVAVIMDNFEYLTRDSSILGPHHMDEFVRCWSQFDPQATGRIFHSELYELMCSLQPPVGFGRNCPKIFAYKRLIQMNMPMDPDGTVSFYTTLISLIRLGLDFYTKGNSYEKDKELKKIIKTIWPTMEAKSINKFFPKPTNDSQLTVGKIYCMKLFVYNYRKSKGQIIESSCIPVATPTVMQRIQAILPNLKNRKLSNLNISVDSQQEIKVKRNLTFSGAKIQNEYQSSNITKKELSRKHFSLGNLFLVNSTNQNSATASIRSDLLEQ
nr:voltage-dependent R-type calcium channel subunit alpha-1E isoform X2 [Hydra vulgaris]